MIFWQVRPRRLILRRWKEKEHQARISLLFIYKIIEILKSWPQTPRLEVERAIDCHPNTIMIDLPLLPSHSPCSKSHQTSHPQKWLNPLLHPLPPLQWILMQSIQQPAALSLSSLRRSLPLIPIPRCMPLISSLETTYTVVFSSWWIKETFNMQPSCPVSFTNIYRHQNLQFLWISLPLMLICYTESSCTLKQRCFWRSVHYQSISLPMYLPVPCCDA